MSIDMRQFKETFIEESIEGLDVMESELLHLDVGTADSDVINTIFRAAHSIKGGSATFGMDNIATFTHLVETLLDEMRDGRRQVTQEAVDLLLKSVDCIREMILAAKRDENLDPPDLESVKQQLQVMLDHASAGPVSESVAPVAQVEAQAVTGWVIKFKPLPHLYRTGNDPLRMLRELSRMGDMSVVADSQQVPDLDNVVVDECYLSWEITLNGDQIDERALREVFEWVDGDCELDIQAQTAAASSSPAAASPAGADTVELLESSFALLAPRAEELVRTFYSSLFKKYPDLTPMFANTTMERQSEKLVAALSTVVGSLRNPEGLAQVLRQLGEKHVNYGVKPDHYPKVAEVLLATMKSMAGDAWTNELQRAWSDALNQVAMHMLSAHGVAAPAAPVVAPAAASKPSPAAAAPAGQPAPAKTTTRSAPASEASSSIRVSTDKVDALINIVGELVITQSMLSQLGEEFDMAKLDKLRDGLAQLERNTRELQENVMRIRMLPISFVFSRFPRMVHDLSSKLGKQVELKLSGEQTELDKTVMEKIGDPMVHLVRNALDHGVEMPDVRKAKGKPPVGQVKLNAYHMGGNIVIEITDDGAGLDKEKIMRKAREKGVIQAGEELSEEQIHDLIFHPGFSTADQVSDVSGRGVGMDVVKKNIKSLGGSVEIRSELGVGSTFIIRLPLTLAILDGQLIRVKEQTYIVPLVSIIESIQVTCDQVNNVAATGDVFKLRDEYIPIVKLYQLFGMREDYMRLEEGLLVVVEGEGKKVGLFVDDLLGQQQVVIKSLESNFKRVEGVSGATILGDGTVALILDISGIIHLSKGKGNGKGRKPTSAAA